MMGRSSSSFNVNAIARGLLAVRAVSAGTARPISTSRAVVTSGMISATKWELDSWVLSGSNPAAGEISVPATVPGNAHLALMDAGILDTDPLFRYQETNYSWVRGCRLLPRTCSPLSHRQTCRGCCDYQVAETNWTYTSTFTTPADVLNLRALGATPKNVAAGCFLALDGVDTVSGISVGEICVGGRLCHQQSVCVCLFYLCAPSEPRWRSSPSTV